jgi:two-component system, OmpR family, sensor kinase
VPIYDDLERQAAALAMQHALAHDLRAPLRHIHAFSSLLREQIIVREDPEALRLLRVITDAAGQADHMVAALARLASLEAADVNISAVALLPLCSEAANDVARQWPGRRLLVQLDLASTVLADAALLRALLHALLHNAMRFSPGDAARVDLTECVAAADSVQVSIRDEGVGFPAAGGTRLPAAFNRLHDIKDFPAPEDHGGTGLVGARILARRMGGSLQLALPSGVGAELLLTLRRAS